MKFLKYFYAIVDVKENKGDKGLILKYNSFFREPELI